MIRRLATAAVLGLCLAGVARADDDATTLTIGDAAPPIDIGHWVKGKPVTKFEDGKVYVMEFWATWCGPCRASMPHISEMQAKYKDYDVTVIGVSDEPLETVVNFLTKTNAKTEKLWYETIGYTLTTDPDASVKKAYFTAAGQTGIPCSFIVGKDQKIEWIGHPMSMEDALEKVVRDTWDRDAFKVKWEEEQGAKRAMNTLRRELGMAIQAEEWDTAIELIDGVLARYPNNTDLLMQKFQIMLGMDNSRGAYEVGEQVAKANWDNAMMLNALAWTVADDARVQRRDLDFALRTATRANELTGNKDAAILDTLARVFYEQGKLEQAVEIQRRAAEFAGDDRMGDGIRATLEKYEKEMKKG